MDRHETLPKRVSDDSGRFVFRRRKILSAKFSDQKNRFSLVWCGFGGATAERTSKSASSSNFALDGLNERSVRSKNLGFRESLGFLKNFHPIVVDNFSGGIISTASCTGVRTHVRACVRVCLRARVCTYART